MQAGTVFIPYKNFVGSFIPNGLMSYKGLSSTAKLCWSRLAQYSGKKGNCYPSQEALADEIGVSIIQVQRLIKELVNKRFIDIKRSSIDKIQHKTNRYIFLWHECLDVSQPIIDDVSQPIIDDVSIVRESVVRESVVRESKEEEEKNSSSLTDPLSLKKIKTDLAEPPKKPVLSDEEWLNSLKSNKAYEGIDIERLQGKMIAWCELKGKKPTRARLLNWLNREEKPIGKRKEKDNEFHPIWWDAAVEESKCQPIWMDAAV